MEQSGSPLILADYTIIGGFFLIMLAVGFYFAGGMRDAKDYLAGGKRVPWWLSRVSYSSTSHQLCW